ncbi:hypothetical protein [Engelhardtia mirabilis]|uniref:DUF1565 domain-containing protein n=1 Tax=Engelhardtia mirabilis TaxID=2528011 RepID=A0A518BDX6_9BACT|nr:hypothetical protein Pla133_02510 [Planctomycetes bacterium Pla133]QDU99513.1 hypothetical protein Pla86_02510 [Planctomycetes bacterium Pla86]
MLLALASLALAPQIWTIDDDGPADFADLPAAVAAASDGDILQLMPGDYTGTTITKDLKLFGYVVGFFESVKIVHPGLVVDGSGGGPTTITLLDLQVEHLVLRNLPGRVRLDATSCYNVEIEGCADVVLTRAGFGAFSSSLAALTVTDSKVSLVSSGIAGGIAPETKNGTAGLALSGESEVSAVGTRIIGGNAGDLFFGSGTPGPAIRVLDGAASLTVRGSSNHEIAGGYDPSSPLAPALTQVPSVQVLGGTLDLTWSGVDFSDAPTPPLTTAEPYLQVGPTIPASPLNPYLDRELTVFGAPGDVAVVAVAAGSSTSLPTSYLGENLRVDLGQLLLLELLVLQGQNVPATAIVTPPTGPSVVGIEVDVQALVALAGGGSFVTNSAQILLK